MNDHTSTSTIVTSGLSTSLTRTVLMALATLAAAVAAWFGAGQPGVAAQSTATISAGQASVVAGSSFGASGTCPAPDAGQVGPTEAEVRFTLASNNAQYALVTATPDASNGWAATIAVPANAPAGTYDAQITCSYVAGATPLKIGGQTTQIQVVAPQGPATLTVSPASGVRPLTITVNGSACAAPNGDATGHSVKIEATRNIGGEVVVSTIAATGSAWATSLTLSFSGSEGDWIGDWTVRTSCLAGDGSIVFLYPDAFATATALAPELSVAPTSIVAGNTVTATANRCPDPEVPALGGDYRVVFTASYLPPGGATGSWSETIVGTSLGNGTSSAVFTIPSSAPTTGNAYRMTAVCQFSELSPFNDLFSYTAAGFTVLEAFVTPTVTATPVPSATPTATATAAPTSSATATPEPTTPPTATATSSATAVPTATTKPDVRPRFTG